MKTIEFYLKTLLLLLTTLLIALGSKAQNLSPQQLKSDFATFKTALKEIHPGMYRYTTERTYDSLYEVIEKQLEKPMSRQEFYIHLNPVIAALRCGHTKWMADGKPETYPFHDKNLFPLKLYFVGEKAWIEDSYVNSNVPKGAEILSINGERVSTLIGQLLPKLTFADGNTVTGKYEDLNKSFSGFFSTFNGTSESYEIVYKTNSEEKSIHLPSVTYADIENYHKSKEIKGIKPFRVNYLNDKTALLRIERFWSMKEEQDYKKFLDATFEELKAKNIENLILDLRGNEGGEETNGILLYTYLTNKPFHYYKKITAAQKKKITVDAYLPKFYGLYRLLFLRKSGSEYHFKLGKFTKKYKPQQNAFQGKVYTLTNGNSFSVTTEFSSILHSNKRATFIGRETGGGYYGDNSGVFGIVVLPESKLVMGIPMLGFYNNVSGYPFPDRGIIPDHIVTPTIKDIIQGNDRDLEVALELINKN